MIQPKNITLIATIVLAFIVFNMGLPVVLSLCPMEMENASLCCSEPIEVAGSHSFSNQVGECCASYIVAERNQIPFVGSNRLVTPQPETVGLLTLSLLTGGTFGVSSQGPLAISPLLQESPPSLFLLHSALLI